MTCNAFSLSFWQAPLRLLQFRSCRPSTTNTTIGILPAARMSRLRSACSACGSIMPSGCASTLFHRRSAVRMPRRRSTDCSAIIEKSAKRLPFGTALAPPFHSPRFSMNICRSLRNACKPPARGGRPSSWPPMSGGWRMPKRLPPRCTQWILPRCPRTACSVFSMTRWSC